ncbi:MAG TPA: carboxypeptidase regulatory-like domain-containing protein, partial [Armatimonadota bacterium]|nr:carboxypeptidase regulatory-like domain-containing protein [Armatimonadota bacterium]
MACLTMVGLGAIATAQDPTDMLTLPCRVVQADGEPLANAELSVSLLIGQPTGQQTSTTKTVTTDEDGRFEMTSARAGSWRVAISAEAAGWAIAPPAEVKPGIDPELVTAQLQPGGDVLGWVRVRGEDEPIAGASVSCTVFGAESGLRSKSTTDEDGTFIFSGVVPGEVSVYASADGFVSSRAAAQVALDEEPVEIVVELTRALTLQGTVVGPDGATPLVGATVRWSGSREEKTDGEGRFLLMNVRPRNVRMTVLAEGYAPVARTVEVTEGVEPDDVRIVVEHVGGIVSGQVTDSAAGAPAPDQLVLIVPGGTFQSGPRLEGVDAAEAERELGGNAWSPYYGSEWSYATRTDAEGRYRVEHVPPGMCEVAMIHAVRPNMGRRDVEVRDG